MASLLICIESTVNRLQLYLLPLLRSLPRVDATEHDRLYSIPGRPPDLNARPPGCPFAPRCTFVRDVCHTTFPDEVEVGPSHRSACHATDEVQALVTRGGRLGEETG